MDSFCLKKQVRYPQRYFLSLGHKWPNVFMHVRRELPVVAAVADQSIKY